MVKKKKLDDRKGSLYKFTIMPLSHSIIVKSYIFFLIKLSIVKVN